MNGSELERDERRRADAADARRQRIEDNARRDAAYEAAQKLIKQATTIIEGEQSNEDNNA